MGTPPSKGKLLYHITHIDNMPSIFQHGLLSRQSLSNAGINDFTDIADQSILNRREHFHEALSEFVLFHFYAKNPFDGLVCKKYGSKNMAIITLKRELYKNNAFFIIPSHPLDGEEPDIYPYEEGLSHIKWDILDKETGRDYRNPEIKKACMAECVKKCKIPIDEFAFVFVYCDEAKQKLDELPNGYRVTVKVAPYMFP